MIWIFIFLQTIWDTLPAIPVIDDMRFLIFDENQLLTLECC